MWLAFRNDKTEKYGPITKFKALSIIPKLQQPQAEAATIKYQLDALIFLDSGKTVTFVFTKYRGKGKFAALARLK